MISYRIDATAVHAHTYRVTLTVDAPASEQRLSLPVWVPGSYLVREFARHLSALSATQEGRALPLHQLDKTTWLAQSSAGGGALRISYEVYAFDTSVRAAFLDESRGFFNGTSLLLRVEGQDDVEHRLDLAALPNGWQVATTLTPRTAEPSDRRRPAAGPDRASPREGDLQLPPPTGFIAVNYDELVDHPVELGNFWRGHFTAAGIAHEFVVAGALPDFDGERLVADAARICSAQIAFWHGTGEGAAVPPFSRYLFLLNAVEDGHGGLEHRTSTALIAPRRDLPRRSASVEADHDGSAEPSDAHVGVLGLISHEYFHTWNVKRLRPREFARYDYSRENYTELLWFFEGFTSYYDDLFLRRAGLIDEDRYLKLLARSITSVAASPGRLVQSVAQASFDAWVKYYRADENTPNATISYYAKGSLVALALDLTLRAEGHGSLDDVMRMLWSRSGGGPIDEADIAAALEAVGGRSFSTELAAWVHGSDELPLRELLEATGVEWQAGAPTIAQRLGVRVNESALTGVKVSHVLRGSAAERAGVAPGDEILALAGWRLRRLDEAVRLIEPGQAAPLVVGRDQRLMTLSIELPSMPAAAPIALKRQARPTPPALARLQAWLTG